MSEAMIPADLPLRNDLIGEVPYGAPQLDVPVCLNVNENPYPPDHAVVRSIVEHVKQVAPTLNRYPDREHIELREAFVRYLKEEWGAAHRGTGVGRQRLQRDHAPAVPGFRRPWPCRTGL